MKKVLLINPPSPFLINDKSYPSLGLLSIGSILKERYYVTYLHYSNSEKIPSSDYYLVTSTTPQYPEAYKILQLLKKRKGKKIIGGHHASILTREVFSDGWDSVVCGEAEKIIHQAIEFNGIILGKVINDLNSIPFPDRNLIDFEKSRDLYNPCFLDVDGLVTTMMISRGCPYNCGYCSKAIHGNKLRMRSIDNIKDELNQLVDMGVKGIIFHDDIWANDEKRIYELCQLLEKYNFKWRCNLRVSKYLNKYIFDAMRDAGCIEIDYGIESGSQDILNRLKKGKVKNNIDIIKKTKESGINVKLFMMYGFPWDNQETANDLISFLHETKPDHVLLSSFMPYPGSYFYNKLKYKIADISQCYSVGKDMNGGALNFTELPDDEFYRIRKELINFVNDRGWLI